MEKVLQKLCPQRLYFMQSERVGFSRWSEGDLPLAVSLWGEECVSRYISKTGVFSFDEIKGKLAAEINNEKLYSVQYWPIFELQSGEFVGCCGLRLFGLRPAAEDGVYETGFHLRSKFWGRGFARESALRVIDYAFKRLNAKSLFAGHNPDNVNSKKVLLKLGFEYVSDNFYPPTGLMHPSYILKNV